jgi:hypothetical protein
MSFILFSNFPFKVSFLFVRWQKTALLVFLALAFVLAKTKCAVCTVGFLYVAQRFAAWRSGGKSKMEISI